MADALELLDRQVAFLLKQKESDFFVQLPAFVAALRSEPRLGAIADDLLASADQQLASHRLERQKSATLLLRLRSRLPDAVLDGTDQEESEISPELKSEFQRMADSAAELRWGEAGRAHSGLDEITRMCAIAEAWLNRYRRRFSAEASQESAQEWDRELANLRKKAEHAARAVRVEERSSAGVALWRICNAAQQLNPRPLLQSSKTTLIDVAEEQRHEKFGVRGTMQRFVFRLGSSDQHELRLVAQLEQRLRRDTECFHEEARRRLGLTRSLRAIVNRFKMRAEWHDASTLRELVAADPGKGRSCLNC